ncbi:hypothetical protein PR202_ga24335 [Eleusine coracana subsp. coracana]|uniref:OPA3-like protein n=1 Tax=Eleusine coracana subsp. coracana TaxID=191504 RepID=A0AAV5D8K8_ELECO|nr:hypothetical protein PR202_ga24335 [Eleusine coracana subsp. coracana]
MALPVAKLGTLALRTLSKPIASRLKSQAAVHPKFRDFIISIAQVAVAALFFEVQRSARSEARKEEARKQELEELEQREDSLAKELEDLKLKLDEIERLAKGRGLSGILNFKGIQGADGSKAATPA